MATAPIESMIVEDKSEPEKPVDREKVSFIWVVMTEHLTYKYSSKDFVTLGFGICNNYSVQLDET
jgi:hypothetical protein